MEIQWVKIHEKYDFSLIIYLSDIDETPNDWIKITDPRDAMEIQLYDETS